MCARGWRRHALTTALLLAAHLIKVLSCGEAGATGGAAGGAGGAGGAGRRARRYVGLYTGPYFDPAAPNNITAQLGTHAYLPCKVRQLSNKSVSWIRRRDAHILTVDRFTFIADERFQAFLVEATDTWTLQVKYVQARDAGLYECQVGTEPKMSHFVQLNVVVPRIEIAGEAEVYVKAGSTVRVACVITQALEEPAYIFWYHNDERVLNYDRALVEIRMERRAPDTTIGNLIIYNTRREDSGNYSCSPSNLDSASVVLHVLSGEQPAAMQHGNSAGAARGGVRGALALAVLAGGGGGAQLMGALTAGGARLAGALAGAPRRALLVVLVACLILLPQSLACHDEDEH
ncbi:neurotrimin [Plutella xylostella]|uniref:neurotrimin n=1 Tax=Plutella xylostella TaxID=51655 RepID=UPI0020326433|nr:neurotrimin [Plutella xylostella]